MELIYSTWGPQPGPGGSQAAPILPSHLSDSLSVTSVSSQNVLLFSSRLPPPAGGSGPAPAPPSLLSQSAGSHVLVCDLNTPWDTHRVTSRLCDITALIWDGDGQRFLLADAEGHVQVWAMQDFVISAWQCVSQEHWPAERIIRAQFLHPGKKTILNNDQMESSLYHEKFTRVPGPPIGLALAQRKCLAFALISATGLFALVTMAESGRVQKSAGTLGPRRKIQAASIAYMRDGHLLVASSDGHPHHPILIHSIQPTFSNEGVLSLAIEDFPAIFLQPLSQPGASESSADPYQAVSELVFVKNDDCDSLLIATHHASGGKVQLWELQEWSHTVHKIFASGSDLPAPKIGCPTWRYVEVFSGPSAQVVSMATPSSSIQSGAGSPCYIAVAYSDGSLQCLLRDSLQHIGSSDLPKGRSLEVEVSSMSFTATGNALIVSDTLGQLHLYRMTPISDPGGSHSVPYLVTMYEYCLVSGLDFWDLTICTKMNHIEAICEKLRANFQAQAESNKKFYFIRLTMIESLLNRLSPNLEYKAADLYAKVTLLSIHGAFQAALRTVEVYSFLDGETTMGLSVSNLLKQNPSESDVEKLFKLFQSNHGAELSNESSSLFQSFQHLIQWAATLALHLLAGISEFKQNRKGLGFDLHKDPLVLNILREILYVIRVWGHYQEASLPSFTQGSDFDVVAQCFSMVTKLKENPEDESLQDDCLRLPSQVMLPPLNLSIKARGVSPMVVSYHKTPMTFEFGEEPDSESLTPSEPLFIEGAMTTHQLMDCSKLIYLGKNPNAIKVSTRCVALSHPGSNAANAGTPQAIKSWEKRWLKQCPSGGNWRIRNLTN